MNTDRAKPPSTDQAANLDPQDSGKAQRQPVRHKEGLESNIDHPPDDAASQQQQ